MTDYITDPQEVFGTVVKPEDYDEARIQYPPEFVAQILQNILPASAQADTQRRPCIIDMGAGTGRLGETILNLNGSEQPGEPSQQQEKFPECDVIFVEPNPNSVKFLREKFNKNPRVLGIIEASAEDDIEEDIERLLGGRKADAIVMGDSAHWIKAEEALSNLRDMIVPGGKIAAFARYWAQRSDLTPEIDRLLSEQCGAAYEKSCVRFMREPENLELRRGQHLVNEAENDERGYVRVHEYSQEELLDYFASCSFSAKIIQSNKEEFRSNVIGELWKYAEQHDQLNPDKKLLTKEGKLKVPYQVTALYGEPRIISRHADRVRQTSRPVDIAI